MAALFNAEPVKCADPGLAITDLAELICRAARDYLEQVKQVDLQRVDTKRRDPQRLASLLRSLGRNVSTEVSLASLAAVCAQLGRIPSKELYLEMAAKKIDPNQQELYRYLNFDQIEAYQC